MVQETDEHKLALASDLSRKHGHFVRRTGGNEHSETAVDVSRKEGGLTAHEAVLDGSAQGKADVV